MEESVPALFLFKSLHKYRESLQFVYSFVIVIDERTHLRYALLQISQRRCKKGFRGKGYERQSGFDDQMP